MGPPPPTFVETRDHLHHLAEHVLSARRHAATGRIGLRALPGGFGTPPFGDDEQVGVVSGRLMRLHHGVVTTLEITTPRAAAEFFDGPLGAPADVFTPDTGPVRPDDDLHVDVGSAAYLAEWYAFAAQSLGRLRDALEPEDEASIPQIWPEHFDLAFDALPESTGRRTGFGASPGDGMIAEPYLYVGPWSFDAHTPDDDYWNGGAYKGAVLPVTELQEVPHQVEAALKWLRRGLHLMRR